MKRRICSYDLGAVTDDGYVVTDEGGKIYFCNARCLCIWAVSLATKPGLSEELKVPRLVLKVAAGEELVFETITELARWASSVVFPLPVENGASTGGFIPLPVENSFTCRIQSGGCEPTACCSSPAKFAPVSANRASLAVSPAGFIGGFAMKNACAIVLQAKELFYRLKQISTPLGID